MNSAINLSRSNITWKWQELKSCFAIEVARTCLSSLTSLFYLRTVVHAHKYLVSSQVTESIQNAVDCLYTCPLSCSCLLPCLIFLLFAGFILSCSVLEWCFKVAQYTLQPQLHMLYTYTHGALFSPTQQCVQT